VSAAYYAKIHKLVFKTTCLQILITQTEMTSVVNKASTVNPWPLSQDQRIQDLQDQQAQPNPREKHTTKCSKLSIILIML